MDLNEVLSRAGLRARYEAETPAPHVDPVLAAIEAAEAELGIVPPSAEPAPEGGPRAE